MPQTAKKIWFSGYFFPLWLKINMFLLYSFLKWWHSSVIANSCDTQTISTDCNDLWSAFIMAQGSLHKQTWVSSNHPKDFFAKKEHLVMYCSFRLQLKPFLGLKRYLSKFMSIKIDSKTKTSSTDFLISLSKEKANWNVHNCFQIIVTQRVHFFFGWIG